MNTTFCTSKIPEDIKMQLNDLISKSGMPTEDFIRSLANSYNVKKVESDISTVVLDYTNYWNSFVD
jgi:hypothetical protein